MNLRLHALVFQAESLPDDAKERLADAIESGLRAEGVTRILSPEEVASIEWVLARHEETKDDPDPTDEEVLAWAGEQAEWDDDLTPEELAELDRLAAEPFVEATPEQMARIAAWRG